jgi:hypothetical protein
MAFDKEGTTEPKEYSEDTGDSFNGCAVLIGLFLYLLVMLSNLMHYDLVVRPYKYLSGAKPLFEPLTFWMINLILATIGGLLLDLRRWLRMLLLSFLMALFLQSFYHLYFLLRSEILFVEILIPNVATLLLGQYLYHLMLRWGRG